MYAIYLRKSRADIEAESRGEGETLSRHKGVLLKLAAQKKIEIGEIYTEIVSGESIAARPQMQRLLMDVDNGRWSGVLVMEIERLCRGNGIDQGIVAQAFKESGTLIITPQKTYDPKIESDEEYFEFSLFMSRREYKTINRRLSAGKKAAAAEGKFTGSCAPYGYRKVRVNGDCTLAEEPSEAGVLKNIFMWYANGISEDGKNRKPGFYAIAARLNKLCIPTRSLKPWSPSTVRDILSNPVYIGQIRTEQYRQVIKNVNGERKKCRIKNTHMQKLAHGLHAPLISDELFYTVQKQLNDKEKLPVIQKYEISNPLAGVVECSACSKSMVRRYSKSRNTASLLCTTAGCKNVSSYFETVEAVVMSELGRFYEKLELLPPADNMGTDETADEALLESIELEIGKNAAVLERIFELTERNVYTDEEYIKRRKQLDIKTEMLKKGRAETLERIKAQKERRSENKGFDGQITGFSKYCERIGRCSEKNRFIKCFISKIVYEKQKKGGRFKLDIFVRVPLTEAETARMQKQNCT